MSSGGMKRYLGRVVGSGGVKEKRVDVRANLGQLDGEGVEARQESRILGRGRLEQHLLLRAWMC